MNDARIHIRLPRDVVAWLKTSAEGRRTTVSEIVRQLVLDAALQAERKEAEHVKQL